MSFGMGILLVFSNKFGKIVKGCLALTTFPFTLALAGCLQSLHCKHAQLNSPNGNFVLSGTFHLMWADMGQGILLFRNIFLNKSDQLSINIK